MKTIATVMASAEKIGLRINFITSPLGLVGYTIQRTIRLGGWLRQGGKVGAVIELTVIRERFATSFAQYDWEGAWSAEAIEVSGDLAVMWGPIETVTTRRDNGDRSRSIGYHLDVARRQPDGSWKFTWWATKMGSAPDSITG